MWWSGHRSGEIEEETEEDGDEGDVGDEMCDREGEGHEGSRWS